MNNLRDKIAQLVSAYEWGSLTIEAQAHDLADRILAIPEIAEAAAPAPSDEMFGIGPKRLWVAGVEYVRADTVLATDA